MRKTLITTVSILVVLVPLLASAEDDLTSLSYISYLERYATVQPAGQEENLEASINMPVISGDRIDSARAARVEVVLADGSVLWLDEYSAISFDSLAYSRDTRSDRTVLFLAEGTIILEIPEHALSTEATRIDGSSATVYLNKPGLYRVEALRDGGLRVEVFDGVAEASSSSGGVLVRAENAAEVSAGSVSRIDTHITWNDDFAMWVEQRRQVVAGESSQYVEARYERQAAQLDNYGNWIYIESNDSWAWQPTVGGDWRPYTAGRWYWTPTGWSWISYEPWGWLPYHYGSWSYAGYHGWVWSWHRHWSPAWVYWMHWPGHVGWCPTGYYDHWWYSNYGYWYGWHDNYWWYDHPHGSRPPQTPRRDVIPRPPQRAIASARDGRPVDPNRFGLDLRGVTDVGRVDGRGWNVVSTDDFASARLSRVVEPGETALMRTPNATAVVTSGPLITSRVRVDQARGELERTFRQVRSATPTDLSPVLSRSSANLKPEQALRLVDPRPTDSIARTPLASTTPEVAPRIPRLGSTTSDSAARRATPNLHRPVLSSGSSGHRDSIPPTSRTVGTTVPRTNRDEDTFTLPRVRITPSSRSTITPRSTVSSSSSRSRDTSTSRPVIVPRTSPTRPSRIYSGSSSSSSRFRASPSSGSSSRTTVTPRSSSSSRSSSSARPSSRSSSSSSRSSSSAKPSSRSSSSSKSSSRSSSSSSRSSSSSKSSSSSSKSSSKR